MSLSITASQATEQQAARVRFARQTTLLAWQRFTLELGVLSTVATRLLVPRMGWWFIAVGVIGVGVAAVSLASANRAYRTGRAHLLPAQVRYAMVALAVFAVGGGALWWALTA